MSAEHERGDPRPPAKPGKPRELTVTRGEERFPYSAGAVVEALQSAGVPTEDAMNITRDVERRLRNRSLKEVELEALRGLLATEVRSTTSDDAARRFLKQTPPFVPLLVGPRGKVLTRRRLTSSLEKVGLGFKEANVVALQVEQGIRADGLERIQRDELARRVALILEGRFGRDVRLRYEMITSAAFELRVHEPGGDTLPYSRGILAQSLTAIGLTPELSHNIAKRVETALYATNATVVQRDQVRDQVVSLLRREAGDEFAQRYLMMRQTRRRDKPLVVLFGGAPGVGKSAIASEVGYRLGVPRIVSTDSVRQALRSLIGPDLSPVLHASTYEAWRAELLPDERETATPERMRVLRGFLAQVNQLKPALTAIVQRNIYEATSIVMEGVQLIPGVSPALHVEGATVISIVLSVEDEDDHLKHFATREGQTGNQRGQQNYLAHFEEIRILQQYVTDQALEHRVPVVEASDFDRAVERCVDHVLDLLMLEQRRRLEAAENAQPSA
ncbi:MAG: ATP cone domain-containing protein [Trueperaceae bacterium]